MTRLIRIVDCHVALLLAMTIDGAMDCHVAKLRLGATLAPRNDGGGLLFRNRPTTR